jgi:6-phosphogluconate dehydrogenase
MAKRSDCDIGMIGLGTMGRNLVLNMADHGFPVAGYDRDPAQVDKLESEAAGRSVRGARTLKEFVGLLRKPRTVMLLVPAGKVVDQVIADVAPLLTKGDLIIDGGNSHFTDTDRRTAKLKKKGIDLLGVGISGGEEGARASCPAGRATPTSASDPSLRPWRPGPAARRASRTSGRARRGTT